MNTAQVDFRFPMIGFAADSDVWGFPDRDALTTSGPGALKEGKPLGMELVDSDGRRWIVRSVVRLGRKGPLVRWLLWSLITTRQYRIDYELEALPPLTLAEIKARAKRGVETFPLYWEEPGELEIDLPKRLARVDAATSVSDLFDELGLDWFAAY